MPGTLFVVATPIGNLEDITMRALRVLREVALIAAEDTRRTDHLLARHAISTPTTSLHEHNESKKAPSLIARLPSSNPFSKWHSLQSVGLNYHRPKSVPLTRHDNSIAESTDTIKYEIDRAANSLSH